MYVSVDMGGTNTRVVASRSVESLDYVREPIRHRNTGSYENDLDFIIDSARQLSRLTRTAIQGVGIGTPGTPNPDRTCIESAINLPHWNGRPLTEPISDALDCPVYYDNDAVTAGLGEAYYGNHPREDFHYLIWGTGIGGADIRFDDTGDVIHASKVHWKNNLREWTLGFGGKSLIEQYDQMPSGLSDEQWRTITLGFNRHLAHYIASVNPSSIIFGGGLAHMRSASLDQFSEEHGFVIHTNSFGDDSGVPGGLGLIRYASHHSLPPVDQTDIED